MKKIWIITAMQEEAELIIEKYNLIKTKKLLNINIFEGNIWEKEIILLLSWMWKIQSSLWTSFLILNYNPQLIINIWVAWNISNKKVKVWDVFLPTTFYQHDFYIPFEWAHDIYARSAININKSKIWLEEDFNIIDFSVNVTWDQFIENKKDIEVLKNRFNPDTVEMEAFSILSVAREYNMLDRCTIIKAVSDSADEKASDNIFENIKIAMNNSIKVLDYYLKN